MGAGTPSAGCKRAADESEAQFIFGYLLNLRVAAALLTLLGVATASAQDQMGFRIDLPIIWNKPDSENRSGSVQSGLGDLLFVILVFCIGRWCRFHPGASLLVWIDCWLEGS